MVQAMSHDDFLVAPLHTPPAYAAVVERIQRALTLGLLVPGDRLPAERALSQGMGVSRVTVREALRVLQGEGLLATRRGSGGTTVAPNIDGLRGADSGHEERVREVFELRLALESTAARLAAERHLEVDLDELTACQAAMARSTDVHSFRRADSKFHLTVARMSGNHLLRQAIEDARAVAFSTLDRRSFTPLQRSSIHDHAAVLQAIERREPPAAADAMMLHIVRARAEVESILSHTEQERALHRRGERTP